MTRHSFNQFDRVPSPTREALYPLPSALQLHPPSNPGTQRSLRRLHSAHNLGAKAAAQTPQQSIRLRQHHFQYLDQHLQPHPSVSPATSPVPAPATAPNLSPAGRHAGITRSAQRARSNSDAVPIPNAAQIDTAAMTAATATRRSALSKRSLAADAMSLDRLLREGPPDGDVEGALESARLKILDQGIKSDSDGMVSGVFSFLPPCIRPSNRQPRKQRIFS